MLTIDQNPERMSARHIAVMALRDAGVANDEIARTLGITKTYPSKIAGKLQKRYDLTSPKYVKLAANAIKQTLQGKAIGDASPPKTSDVINTAGMVYDRYQAKVTKVDATSINLDITLDYAQVVGKYKRAQL